MRVRVKAVIEGDVASEEIADVLMREAAARCFNPDDAGLDWCTDHYGRTYIGFDPEWCISSNPEVAALVDAHHVLRGHRPYKIEDAELRQYADRLPAAHPLRLMASPRISDADLTAIAERLRALRPGTKVALPGITCDVSEIIALVELAKRGRAAEATTPTTALDAMTRLHDLLNAILGWPGTPREVSPLSWLREALLALRQRGPADSDEDPDAWWEMIREVEALVADLYRLTAEARPEPEPAAPADAEAPL